MNNIKIATELIRIAKELTSYAYSKFQKSIKELSNKHNRLPILGGIDISSELYYFSNNTISNKEIMNNLPQMNKRIDLYIESISHLPKDKQKEVLTQCKQFYQEWEKIKNDYKDQLKKDQK